MDRADGDRDGTFVLSGAAAWPLLAALAAGARGRTRNALREALGLPIEEALPRAIDLLRTLQESGSAHAALAVWVRRDIPINTDWSELLPEGTLQSLSGTEDDRAMLDAWVRNGTLEILDRFPVEIDANTLLVLAQAVALRLEWSRPFDDVPLWPPSGPWEGRVVAGLYQRLEDLDRVSVATSERGTVSMFRSEGADDVDVHLVIGEVNMTPSDVLHVGIDAAAGEGLDRRGSELAVGDRAPALSVIEIETPGPEPPTLRVETARFDIGSDHDLNAHPDLFGLTDQKEPDAFAGISDIPLMVQSACQVARAVFTATGFEAAAITAILDAAAAMARRDTPSFRTMQIEITFDRPFGFLAVHRETGLVLFAGWVAEPEDYVSPRWDPKLT